MNPENYLARIAYTGPLAPTHATLAALCAHHIDAIPFENIDVLLDRGIDISAEAVEAKLVTQKRGGYCFEHNGLLKRVLIALGFKVESLAARVLWRALPTDPLHPRTHAVSRVWLEGRPWLVDVGFGGWVPRAPLALFVDDAPQSIGPDTFRLVPGAGPGTRLIETQIDGVWRALYDMSQEALLDVDYLPLNWFTSTHPRSIFRRDLRMARTTPDARYTLLNGLLTIRYTNDGSGGGQGADTERRELDPAQLESALGDIFGLQVEASWRPLLQRLCYAAAK